jgi:hypothetical protein
MMDLLRMARLRAAAGTRWQPVRQERTSADRCGACTRALFQVGTAGLRP